MAPGFVVLIIHREAAGPVPGSRSQRPRVNDPASTYLLTARRKHRVRCFDFGPADLASTTDPDLALAGSLERTINAVISVSGSEVCQQTRSPSRRWSGSRPETSELLAEITTVILQSRLPAGARSGTVVEAISAWPKCEDTFPHLPIGSKEIEL